MRRLNVILTDICSNDGVQGQLAPSLGLLYLAAFLRTKFTNVKVFYVPQKYGIEYISKMISEIMPVLIGIYVSSYVTDRCYRAIP
jgi:hypothetical protein